MRWRVLLGFLCLAALVLPHPVGTSAHTISAPETKLLDWVNSYRARVPARRLVMNHTLAEYARTQSYQMAKQQSVFHSSWTRLRKAADACCPGWDDVGELVGRCPDLYDCYLGFYHSPAHRALMADKAFTLAGVGVVDAGGVLYVTVLVVG